MLGPRDPQSLALLIPILGLILSAVVAIVCSAVRGALETKAREQSRREIAAYVAEASISAEDAERLLKSEPSKRPRWKC